MNYDLKIIKDQIIDLNRVLLLLMTEGERVLFLESVFNGYCQNCGRITGDKTCHCTSDE